MEYLQDFSHDRGFLLLFCRDLSVFASAFSAQSLLLESTGVDVRCHALHSFIEVTLVQSFRVRKLCQVQHRLLSFALASRVSVDANANTYTPLAIPE